jgi:hypothetical protein
MSWHCGCFRCTYISQIKCIVEQYPLFAFNCVCLHNPCYLWVWGLQVVSHCGQTVFSVVSHRVGNHCTRYTQGREHSGEIHLQFDVTNDSFLTNWTTWSRILRLGITGFWDFVHRPVFWKLGMLYSSVILCRTVLFISQSTQLLLQINHCFTCTTCFSLKGHHQVLVHEYKGDCKNSCTWWWPFRLKHVLVVQVK